MMRLSMQSDETIENTEIDSNIKIFSIFLDRQSAEQLCNLNFAVRNCGPASQLAVAGARSRGRGCTR